jgi:mannose-1-phosphate guanylyltransferase
VKAVVLVGGEGTRLRPLTETIPKPLLPLVDRPILDHVLDHLVAHGVGEVLMSSPYLERTFDGFLAARGSSPEIRWVTEEEPLGTGGAIVGVLDRLGSDPFVALNGDILTDLDLTAMIGQHRDRGADATIALHHVEDARAFGLVATDRDGRVTEFREKPSTPVRGDINAGTYVLEPAALRRWDAGRPASIERDVFPALIAEDAKVEGFASEAYWLDLGTPEQYLRAHADLLAGRVGGHAYGDPWLGPGARIDAAARIGRSVAVGEGAVVGANAELREAVLLPGAEVRSDARVRDSIVGPRALVGQGATVERSVLGEGARVPDGVSLFGGRVSAGALAEPS